MLELVRNGHSHDAVRELMHRHAGSVHRFCLRMLHEPQLAADVTQQVFVEAYCNLDRFCARSLIRTWLFGLAHHRAVDARRALLRRRAYADEDGSLSATCDPRPSAYEVLDAERMLRALRACLAELPAPMRTALLMRYGQGLTYPELALRLGEKPGTLQARIARALPALRRAIERFLASSFRSTASEPRRVRARRAGGRGVRI